MSTADRGPLRIGRWGRGAHRSATVLQSGLGSPTAGDRQSHTGMLRARLRSGAWQISTPGGAIKESGRDGSD